MTLSEFRAWLDGFGESIGDAPTPEQWAKIKAKLADVSEGYGGLRAPEFRPYPQGGSADVVRGFPNTISTTRAGNGGVSPFHT